MFWRPVIVIVPDTQSLISEVFAHTISIAISSLLQFKSVLAFLCQWYCTLSTNLHLSNSNFLHVCRNFPVRDFPLHRLVLMASQQMSPGGTSRRSSPGLSYSRSVSSHMLGSRDRKQNLRSVDSDLNLDRGQDGLDLLFNRRSRYRVRPSQDVIMYIKKTITPGRMSVSLIVILGWN